MIGGKLEAKMKEPDFDIYAMLMFILLPSVLVIGAFSRAIMQMH